jgi:hypothetical protein
MHTHTHTHTRTHTHGEDNLEGNGNETLLHILGHTVVMLHNALLKLNKKFVQLLLRNIVLINHQSQETHRHPSDHYSHNTHEEDKNTASINEKQERFEDNEETKRKWQKSNQRITME